jgi:porphobilinogen synthase
MMLRAAIDAGAIDRDRAITEYHTAIARAGCDLIITYYAVELAAMLRRP